jgi:two-component system C4-dicarboxylate transport sensor histidine kinase DctB
MHSSFDYDYILSSRPLASHPLTIRVLTAKSTLLWSVLSFMLITTLLFVIVYLTVQLNYQRLLKKRQFEQLQSESKQKLEFLVMERTAELHAEINVRTKTELALRQTQNELVQAAKLAVLGQMSASISHELNNPLAAIRSFADNGRRFLSKHKVERADENLSRISALTDRMAKISGQLRSFARKSDSDEIRIAEIEPVINSAIDLVNPQLKSNQVSLTLHLPKDKQYKAEINTIQLEQVLINLFTNAIQALETQPEKQIHLTLKEAQAEIKIHIDDNGPGIPDTTRQSLFEPFYTTKKSGLGLGLSISQQIITTMKGSLSMESSPLMGARFTISLPASQPEEQ